MRTSILLKVLTASAATANAFLLPNLSLNGIRQFILNTEEEIALDYVHTDILAEQRKMLGDVKESHNPDVVSAWEMLQNEFSPELLKQKIREYNTKVEGKIRETENSLKKIQKPSEQSNKHSEFEILSNDRFEDYSFRVKKTFPEVLGIDTVEQYTGYLDVESLGKHFFYWFFESRNDPENDPVILWLNGGPGCSSSTGLFFELGPSSINATLQPNFNPYSWNSNASVIFLDQPVGVGYSYTEGDDITSTDAAAKDVFVFLELFFQKFPQFLQNTFHIAGESYAGHYIPSFASEIINRADRTFELSSVLIGNGLTDSLTQSAYYKPMACGEGGYKPVLSEEECETMEKDYPKCATLVKLCYDAPSVFTCIPASLYCNSKLLDPYSKTGLNVYDIRMKCEDSTYCYEAMNYLEEYLNLEFVKQAVGAENIEKFEGCSNSVGTSFLFSGDEPKPFQTYVAELLEKGIPVLIYAGDKDFICNWLGNHAWSDELDYFQHDQFAAENLKPWFTKDGKLAGEVKNYGIFTFLRVYDAGHMVPYNQPENSLDMVNRWIRGDYSFGH